MAQSISKLAASKFVLISYDLQSNKALLEEYTPHVNLDSVTRPVSQSSD